MNRKIIVIWMPLINSFRIPPNNFKAIQTMSFSRQITKCRSLQSKLFRCKNKKSRLSKRTMRWITTKRKKPLDKK